MFIDGNSQQRPDDFSGFESKDNNDNKKGRYIVYAIYAFLFLVISLTMFFVFFSSDPPAPKPAPKDPVATSTGSTGVLPDDPGGNNLNPFASSTDSGLKGEQILFGNYYIEPDDDSEVTLESYDLPIEVKVDVSNYYELSRKVNLDDYLDDLNNHGFAILDNQFTSDANDFFGMNRVLSSKEIPVAVTSDLIFYYYQNILKEVYKDIQKNAFYENVWDINKSLYDSALARYRKKRLEVGDINDPVLEGARLELAYFAVALKILVPTDKQVNRDETPGLIGANKFNEQEADYYSFNLPSYLEDDVLKEVGYIRLASAEEKSPVLLYPKNYKDFKVASDYKTNAKLNNFYLAMKWMNSNFPLHYKTSECPECLLDKNDWLINFIAANFVTKDLFANQEARNQWAVVYKFISFFSGLRSDLTYLHYNEVMIDLFGEDYSIEEIFASDNLERDASIMKIQEQLAALNFSEIEGSFKRDTIEDKPKIGMRILQEAYWPNAYIFSHLTGEDLMAKKQLADLDRVANETECINNSHDLQLYRCRNISLDIVNFLHPVDKDNDYFSRNSNYFNYEEKSRELSVLVNGFDKFTNNNNIYWLSLDLGSSLYLPEDKIAPVFTQGKYWSQERNNNTLLGAWVNLHLPSDNLENYFENSSAGSLGGRLACDMNNYVEPDVDFLGEIIARNNMLISMLNVFNVAKTANATVISLKEFNDKIVNLLLISKKELKGEAIDNEDCKFLNSFIKHKIVEQQSIKSLPENTTIGLFGQSIKGVKIVVFIYRKGDKLVMVMGPVFNYQEHSRLNN